MQVTLAVPSSSMRSSTIASSLQRAVSYGGFSRIQLPAKSSDGTDWLTPPERDVLEERISTIRSAGVALALSIATFADESNMSAQVATREALAAGSILKRTRICPLAQSYRERLVRSVMSASPLLEGDGDCLHFAYFRFLNFYQCACARCLDAFAEYRVQQGHTFTFSGRGSLSSQSVIRDWVTWRQHTLAQALQEIVAHTTRPCSIEIDFDHHMRFLAGAEIDEGLALDQLTPHLREVYIHIEALDPTWLSKSDLSTDHPDGYLNHLRLLIANCRASGAEPHLFFWCLGTKDERDAHLYPYLMVAEAVEPTGVVLFSRDPASLAKDLANILH